ncbi:hypothetical protein Taro_039178, partial [Colocasia esculenta]|nr:hypothetical protein [Colocasia esculenta]
MALRLQPLPPVEVPRGHLLFSSSSLPPPPHHPCPFRSLPAKLLLPLQLRHRRSCLTLVSVGKEEVQVSEDEGKELQQEQEASPDDLEYIGQINRVKLTIMIEDPREVERKRLLGVDPDEVTRDDLVSALEDVNEGRIPENRLALRLLSEELLQWPNLE